MDKHAHKIAQDVENLGVQRGSALLVHSSLKSLGFVPGGAETVIQGLSQAVGPSGTLLMPSLSYKTVRSSHPFFDLRATPSCVGLITETFRLHHDPLRSLHPTHSVCAVGPLAGEFITPHAQDATPCGPNSPFHRLPDFDGFILMLGCGLLPNTSMHAVEEIAQVPYLLKKPRTYTLTDKDGRTYQKDYAPHDFAGWAQRYDRVAGLLGPPDLQTGDVLSARTHLIRAAALKQAALDALSTDPYYFVEPA